MPHSVPRPQRDRIDRAIVTRLQVDGRLANVDLADAISLSPSACLGRVKALEADGIIAGYRAEVDRIRAGLDLTVFIELRVEGHSKGSAARIEQALTAIPAVVACYEQLLLDQILPIRSIVDARSTFAIRTVLSRGPLPVEHWR